MKARDSLFKGCTRPPMIFGVPMGPFAAVLAGFILIATWTNILFMLGIIPIYFVMRVLTKKDDQQFRLLFLKIFFCMPGLKNRHFWKAFTSSPISFQKKKPIKLSRRDYK
ncbi:type IV secretion system protein VirB3 [Wohlfahrtiimonas populi]|uniref:type IV secretion system protein VirB3 n=1 Tax=Wohlfahrtiimonas populi TaxID=1940240 RepID=UPI0022B86507|nr:VirB3 family type IV secretion system protein [Wohlfahrtiimonas populi]